MPPLKAIYNLLRFASLHYFFFRVYQNKKPAAYNSVNEFVLPSTNFILERIRSSFPSLVLSGSLSFFFLPQVEAKCLREDATS